MAGTIDQQIALGAVDDVQALPLVGRLHEWVVTVDHKRLGLMYIAGGLFFFLIAGLQAMTIRLQLAIPDAGIVPPQVFNRLITMHGTAMVFLVGMPILDRLLQLPGAADDRRARPRLPAPQRLRLLAMVFGAILLYFSYIGGARSLRRGQRARRRMVRVRTPHRAAVLARQQHRLLDTQYFSDQRRNDRDRHQHNHQRVLHAMRRDDTQQDAGAGVAGGRGRIQMLVALPPLSAAQAMLLLDRFLGAHFFDTQAGGSAILWQHFFWIFGHPEVYILVIPAFASPPRSSRSSRAR